MHVWASHISFVCGECYRYAKQHRQACHRRVPSHKGHWRKQDSLIDQMQAFDSMPETNCLG
jgi:hypothetical protein